MEGVLRRFGRRLPVTKPFSCEQDGFVFDGAKKVQRVLIEVYKIMRDIDRLDTIKSLHQKYP